MMKLGTTIPLVMRIQKYMNHVTHPFNSADISKFSPENSNTELVTQNWIFQSSSLFQSNCIHRSNGQVKQGTCFYFSEMSWLIAEQKGLMQKAEGRGPCNRTAGRMLAKSNNLVLFWFDMVPKYIYLENVQRKHRLNPMGLALCLAMGSDWIIVKQGNSLLDRY